MIEEYPIPYGNRKHSYQVVDDIVHHYSDNKVLFKAMWDDEDTICSFCKEGTAIFNLETIEFLGLAKNYNSPNIDPLYKIHCGKNKKVHYVFKAVYDDLCTLFQKMNEQKIIYESNKNKVSSPILSLEV